MKSKVTAVAVAIATVLAGTLAARGLQEPRQDTLTALLVEVRALRGAIEQMASAGARVQLAMGRLQMQEQRVTAMLRRLDEVRQAAAGVEGQAAEHQRALGQMEDALPGLTAGRLDAEREIKMLKHMIAGAHQELQRLRTEEADLASTVVTEQQRWAEFSRQLDELDRLLRRPPQ